ncbi:hypothetical protein [Streptomyces olivochromogenes]|nr:hypothetical protein [Streptomyces olivochromogenes]
MTGDTRPARIRLLSGLAVHKYVLLRRAVDLSLTALVLLAAAGITTL